MRFTNQKQRIEALRRVPVLAGLSRAMLGDLARRTEDVEVPEGAYLTRQGALGTEAYVVLDGRFAVRRHTRTVATRKKGDVFGEMSLIDGMPRRANVVAEEASHVLVVHKKDFETLLETPRVAKRVMRELATRLQEADDSILG